MQQHPPCSVITAQEVKLQINYVQSSKGCRNINQLGKQNNKPQKPDHSLAFRSLPRLHLRCAKIDEQVQLRMQSIQSDSKYIERRMQCKSIQLGAFSFILGSTGLVVEHARWKEKVLAQY